MAAIAANPSGVHSNGNNNPAAENSQTALRHNPGLARDCITDEQWTLEDLLKKYASETNIVLYSKIAQDLKDKTVRDVALRCRWMNKKENGKRRKDNHNSRKNKEKKEKRYRYIVKIFPSYKLLEWPCLCSDNADEL